MFQKRDKLVHSPETIKNSENSESLNPEFENKESQEKDATKEKLEELIAETEYQIYRFDKVFRHEDNDYKIFEELLEKPCSKMFKKWKNLLLFNLFKSNTILNFHAEECVMSIKDIQEAINKQKQIGVLPLILNQIFQSQKPTMSTPSKLFEENVAFDTVSISVYVASGNKFYNLLTSDSKAYNTTKEIKPSVVKDISCVRTVIFNLKGFILNKKLSLDYICYKIKLSDSKSKLKDSKSKITIFDFQNPSGKSTEKGEKDERDFQKSENYSENFIQPLRILHSTLANNEKNSHVNFSLFVNIASSFTKRNSFNNFQKIGNIIQKPYLLEI